MEASARSNSFIAYVTANKWMVAVICMVSLLRLSFIDIMGPMPQDAYYYFYGQHFALSYFDHPPAIAWILRAFTDLFGPHVFVIKLADTLITICTLLVFYQLSKLFLSRHRAWNAWLLLYSTLMVTVLSLVSTPDVPLMLFWSLSLIAIYRAVFEGRRLYWIWAGIAMGLAFDSKYTAIFLPAGAVLYLLLSDTHRKYLWSPWLVLSVLFFCITISPVVIWNVSNQFASFRFQSSGRVSGAELHPLDFFGVIGHQAAILLPVLLFALFYYLYKIIRKYKWQITRIPAEQLFLLCFFVPIFAGFFILSPVYWVKINWLMPAYITGIIWVSTWLTSRYIRWQWFFAVIVHLGLAVEIIFYPVPIHSDDTMIGWEGLGTGVKAVAAQYPDDFIFSADDYKTSAMLNLYLGKLVYSKNILGENALQFDFIGTDIHSLKGRNAIFINSLTDVNDEIDEQQDVETLRPYFSGIISLPSIVVKLHGRVVRKFLVFRCMDYQPPANVPVKE
ncbi:dolichyl-phosphate-mannose-protein mannosyltransferase [Chitinophaga niastensis]|uniref:Dolichyl-phosphate-mannose-protein mannosyltransferase n=1 Tax=Chitinophaga niastensis TaxID=536980 RepID=A0A2P8HNP5_CHINA|nr:glycosyltransferase family 39 protein [Chitinophaga niastensis]PSL47838.1 dolichyl-phosphate-mannose-protein mannosyltransferase [Chitinophaga niastensis]